MQKPDFIASDIHLGAVPDATERAFLDFLEFVGERGASLLVAGDLFDFWFEYGPIIHGRHFRVLAAVSRLVDAGIPVTLAGGNHDAWGGRFLREEVGVEFHRGPFRTIIAGRPALIAHGDGLGSGDLRYRMLKAVLRSRATILAFRALHPEIGIRIAHAVSRTDTRMEGDIGNVGRARFLEAWARHQFDSDPALGWVVCGHAHVPACIEVEPRRFYVNAGDWIRHFTFVEIQDGTPRLQTWDVARAAPRPTAPEPSV